MIVVKLKADPEDSSVLGVVEGHKLFLWGLRSIVKRKKILEIRSFPCCQIPEREFEPHDTLKVWF